MAARSIKSFRYTWYSRYKILSDLGASNLAKHALLKVHELANPLLCVW